jgi:hypothetical protein
MPLGEGAQRVGDPVRVLPGLYHWLWCARLHAAGLKRVALSLTKPVRAVDAACGSAAVRRLGRWCG